MKVYKNKIFCDFRHECIDDELDICDNGLTMPIRNEAHKQGLPIAIYSHTPDCFKEILRCKECGGRPCICCGSSVKCDDSGCTLCSTGKWAAHCMECDNAIGKKGVHDNCADSQKQAIDMWNKLNE